MSDSGMNSLLFYSLGRQSVESEKYARKFKQNIFGSKNSWENAYHQLNSCYDQDIKYAQKKFKDDAAEILNLQQNLITQSQKSYDLEQQLSAAQAMVERLENDLSAEKKEFSIKYYDLTKRYFAACKKAGIEP